MPFRRILFETLASGAVLAVAALFWKRWDFSLGALVGALLACAGLLHLKAALRKVLAKPESGSPGPFLFASVLRWAVWAVVLFLLLKVSLACLAGAALSYMAFLISLTFHGLRHASGPKVSDGPPLKGDKA
jgi:hypothetical protein